MVEFEKCDCGNIAVYWYAPASEDKSNPHYCEDCVSRGCTCNQRYVSPDAYSPPLDSPDLPNEEDNGIEGVDWHWMNDEHTIWEYIDEEGRPYPCCEYWYEKDGWEVEDE